MSRPRKQAVILLPYCPIPMDTGGKREMWQCVEMLRTLGRCRILSAGRRPVGAGWTPEILRQLESDGYEVVLREQEHPHPSWQMTLGLLWGAFFKSIHATRAFGHANPYHRWAFPMDWWRKNTADADVAVIAYSFWAHLPTSCPKILLLLDLWSNTTWSDRVREARDISGCDRVIVISKDEERCLNERGILHTHWSPPAISRADFPLPPRAGLVGSASVFNREGMTWLSTSSENISPRVRVYGGLARHAAEALFDPVGAYVEDLQPYRECGIILMTTVQGMGVQIKSIEALAAGRAIVARRGAMRGIPPGDGAWVEVDTPAQMMREATRLVRDAAGRETLGRLAHDYYRRHLDSERIRADLARIFIETAGLGASRQTPEP